MWTSLEKVLRICEEQKIELLLIAGDLFHRQPLKRELKELNYLFSKLTVTEVVLIAGNHDHIGRDSFYRTFVWAENVHMLRSGELSVVEIPQYAAAVYGLSYYEKEISQNLLADAYAQGRQPCEILLAHGGDERHIPMRKEELLRLGYDYIALGHIHKPQQICPGKIAYAGALEPIDKNDTGSHGYLQGEITEKGCKSNFIPAASREYVHMEIPVNSQMTGYEVQEEICRKITERGMQNIYKLILTGQRDTETLFDTAAMDPFGNVIEIIDNTVPSYRFDKIKRQNGDNILAQFIESFEGCEEGSVAYRAMCEGVHALMETRRG